MYHFTQISQSVLQLVDLVPQLRIFFVQTMQFAALLDGDQLSGQAGAGRGSEGVVVKMFRIHVIDTVLPMNRFLKLCIFRVPPLFAGIVALALQAASAQGIPDEPPEFIKSLATERENCRTRLRNSQFDEAAESCRAWVTLAKNADERSEALSILGQAYASAGDMDEAKTALDEAASYYAKARDATSVEKWVRMQALRARLAEGRDLMEQARFIYVQTEERARAAVGFRSAAFALAAENRAAFLARQGEIAAATDLYLDAVSAYDAVFGPYNERSLETVLNLAVAQIDQKQPEKAEATLKTLLGAMRLGKREKSEGAAEALTFLGNLRVEQRDFGTAIAYFKQALAVRESLHGPRDLRTAQSLNSLGITQLKLGEYKRAEQALSSAYAIRVAVLGPDDPQTVSSLEAVRAVIELQKRGRLR